MRTIIRNLIFIIPSSALTILLLFCIFQHGDRSSIHFSATDVQIMDTYDTFIAECKQNAHEGALTVDKLFWIKDGSDVPIPDQSCYGETDDPATLQWLLDEASDILDGQETLFNTEVEIYPESKVTYYLDETIFAITWKQVFNEYVYTMSEVKIAHPSQFRRYLAGDEYDSDYLFKTTDMAATVNAVVASSADFYKCRNYGIIVYDGQVRRVTNSKHTDVCYIDKNGDLIFTYRGDITEMEAAQKFVDENDISFSLAFGPILVDHGQRCEPASYALGEANDEYPRAALCQQGKLHYLIVTANGQGPYWESINIHQFAAQIATFGCEKAYTLDGGRTGTIAMNNKLMNPMERQYDTQRPISDIIYFATALPNK